MMSTTQRDLWPRELRLAPGGRSLHVSFESGEAFDIDAEYLRVMSPSAEVQGHNESQRKTVGGKRQVAIIGVEPVGTYAVRLSFDDMHDTGIYTWRKLFTLGATYATAWQTYLDELTAKGLSRDKAGMA
jgi:DUF971 family protein